MYCELGGGVCGEIDTLGNEKETDCIVSGEGAYVGRSTRLGTRKRLIVLRVGRGRMGGERHAWK